MPETLSFDPSRSGGRLRLDTLVQLRWFAVIGQSAAVLAVHFGFSPIPAP
jgi:two-component system sensor histidine kinase RegB